MSHRGRFTLTHFESMGMLLFDSFFDPRGRGRDHFRKSGPILHHKAPIFGALVGNVISTTPQLSPIQKIVGKFKKDFGASINNYITWHP